MFIFRTNNLRYIFAKANNSGLSLTELLVASILVGIVMLGVVSFTYTIREIQDTTSRSAILASRTAATMAYFRRDISTTIGDGSSLSSSSTNVNIGQGVRWYDTEADRGSICFRQDDDGTPDDYTDDDWICYYHGSSFDIHRYYKTTSVGVPCQSSADCENGATSNTTLTHITRNDFFNVNPDSNGRLQSIDIYLETIYDPDNPVDAIENPSYYLTSSFSPISHSR